MIILTVFILVVIVMISAPLYIRQRRTAHDMRQLVIYNNVVDRIMKQAIEGDMPRNEALIILNAARDTYNESVQKHKNIQQTPFPEVHLDEVVGVGSRNDTSSKGKKSEGKKPNQPARWKLDGNP